MHFKRALINRCLPLLAELVIVVDIYNTCCSDCNSLRQSKAREIERRAISMITLGEGRERVNV